MRGRPKGGPAADAIARLGACLDRGLAAVEDPQRALVEDTLQVLAIADCLDPTTGTRDDRRARFEALAVDLAADRSSRRRAMAKVMTAFTPGLFVGPDDPTLPTDNLALERAFRLPKQHQRHVHGRAHAGSILVRRGATRVPALDAHRDRHAPFATSDLVPYLDAPTPPAQRDALARARVMRAARSRRQRTTLLQELERRFLDSR